MTARSGEVGRRCRPFIRARMVSVSRYINCHPPWYLRIPRLPCGQLTVDPTVTVSGESMDYELASQLKDAGLPQNGLGFFAAEDRVVGSRQYSETFDAYVPSLSELIAACGAPLRPQPVANCRSRPASEPRSGESIDEPAMRNCRTTRQTTNTRPTFSDQVAP